MLTPTWQLQTPITAVIFDCDGTLSTIEGIDELANNNNVGDIVQSLTREAMGKSGMTLEIYEERLTLVQPTKDQVYSLGKNYFAHQIPHAADIINSLKRLNKSIYIISAGLYPAVAMFGEMLQIPPENIFAVDVEFNAMGHYLNFDRTSPLVQKNGKRTIVNQLKNAHPTLAYVGDGLSDYEVYDLVTRFVGYGGAFYRENIAASCQYYIKTLSLAALLPLSLTEKEYQQLTVKEKILYDIGVAAIQEGHVKAY
jgi:phosphoserine phosphatase